MAAALGLGGVALAVLVPGRGNATITETLPSTNPTAVPRPQCQPDDMPEGAPPLHLQGQVPWADRLSGRAAFGYTCNLEVVGNWGSQVNNPIDTPTVWANFDTYKDCAYFSDSDDSAGGTGTRVLDVSNAAAPVQTEYLTTPAMTGPWESLRVHAKRGLLVADNNGTRALAIYDVSEDCRHPELLFSGNMPTAVGHEGWFSADGNTWWMSRLGTVVPIDISDPTNPQEMGNWPSSHGGWSSDDGTRQYFCQTGTPDKLVTLDSSDIQFRVPNPQSRTISSYSIVDNSACQQTYAVQYGDHPYVIQFGELAPGSFPGASCPYNPYTNFSHPRIIDMADEQNPVVISEIMNEVELPSNCQLIQADRNNTNSSGLVVVFQLFVYGTHQCTPDRLHDPTILACAEFSSGLRVYDIRDPYNPKELAYFNPGTKGVGSTTMDQAPARPVIRATRGQIWYGSQFHGFYVLRFKNGVYPFPSSITCAPTYDYFFAHYNPETACVPTAVAVRRLVARWRGASVHVSWRTAADAYIAGFNVYRKAGHGPFRKLNRRLIPARSATAGAAYRFVDRSVQRSEMYVYRLEVFDTAGTRDWYALGATP